PSDVPSENVLGFARAVSWRIRRAQGSSLADPLTAFELVELARDVLAAVEQAPGPARFGPARLVEEQQRAVETLGFLAPLSVRERDQRCTVGGRAIGRQQHRLAFRMRRIGAAVSKEILGRELPKRLVEPFERAIVAGDYQQPLPLPLGRAGDQRENPLDRLRARQVEAEAHFTFPSSLRAERSNPGPLCTALDCIVPAVLAMTT